ncbi:MAG: hypothetical protein MUO54_06280, partial [Anaerolineales bacterium]|nr:hypothetical protein [Anaerolineales bacterium]
DAPIDLGPLPAGQYHPESLYWRHERLHREVIKNYPERVSVYQSKRDELEEEFIRGALALRNSSPDERKAYSEDCFKKADAASTEWLVESQKLPVRQNLLHSLAWNGFNKSAGF